MAATYEVALHDRRLEQLERGRVARALARGEGVEAELCLLREQVRALKERNASLELASRPGAPPRRPTSSSSSSSSAAAAAAARVSALEREVDAARAGARALEAHRRVAASENRRFKALLAKASAPPDLIYLCSLFSRTL